MKVIVGLGNPGQRFQETRHNVGFMFLDYLAQKFNLEFVPGRRDYFIAEGSLDGQEFVLIKPTTYMNLSGRIIHQYLTEHRLLPQDVMVVYDDVNLEFGRARVKNGGGSGGHNGIESCIQNLGTNRFSRLRIGIGKSFDRRKILEYVLSPFTDQEIQNIIGPFEYCSMMIYAFVKDGVDMMLNLNSMIINSQKGKQDIPDEKKPDYYSEYVKLYIPPPQPRRKRLAEGEEGAEGEAGEIYTDEMKDESGEYSGDSEGGYNGDDSGYDRYEDTSLGDIPFDDTNKN
ncbi:MAG: aminoacyl-tRNA hydrolase [Ignavibacteriaceae bacterium]|nr:aminoacyl-tRNA hydrolase [Ignavibacteriaceae bacterium]